MEIFQQPPVNPEYLFSAMVGMPRRAVPARVVAGGTNIRATLAIEGVAPLHAARTSQRDVPTTLNRYCPKDQPQRPRRFQRSGTGVSPVRIVQPTHGRDARATTV